MTDFRDDYRKRTAHLPAARFVPLAARESVSEQQMLERAHAFHALMRARRSVRQFSDKPVPRHLIELAVATAATAPSGAHRQPWRFVAIDNPALKAQLRKAAEQEEMQFYRERATDEWLEALHPLGTDHVKTHMTDAPWLVVLFAEKYGLNTDGSHRKNYYVDESVGIAAGMFITAIHNMGLATLPHTPSPMKFLRDILGRGKNEKAVLLMPVGYPADHVTVPDLDRLPIEAVLQWNQT